MAWVRGDQHSYAVAGSVNWDGLSGRHFGNVYEKSLRKHIPFDPVILCIKKIYPKEKNWSTTHACAYKICAWFYSLRHSSEYWKTGSNLDV